jgi:Fur family ferric uptake transcriptional regulator
LADHYPLTLDQLFQLVSQKNKAKPISHSTVFRIIEQFLKVGIVEKLSLETETTPLYQLKEKDHHHQLVCTACKKIVLIEDCPLQAFENKMANQHHFVLHHHQFTLYGLCSNCQKKH